MKKLCDNDALNFSGFLLHNCIIDYVQVLPSERSPPLIVCTSYSCLKDDNYKHKKVNERQSYVMFMHIVAFKDTQSWPIK